MWVFTIIVQNTLAVLGPATEKRAEWRATLIQLKSQATENDADRLVALLEAVIGLLDANGNPGGSGINPTGICAKTWQSIMITLLRNGLKGVFPFHE